MSKRKRARFRLQPGETLLKKGMMDYCMTGGYGHAAMGDMYLTDRRIYYYANLKYGDFITLEIPLSDVNYITKTGIPVLTRSILVVADGRQYRFNVFPMGRWMRALQKAVENHRALHQTQTE